MGGGWWVVVVGGGAVVLTFACACGCLRRRNTSSPWCWAVSRLRCTQGSPALALRWSRPVSGKVPAALACPPCWRRVHESESGVNLAWSRSPLTSGARAWTAMAWTAKATIVATATATAAVAVITIATATVTVAGPSRWAEGPTALATPPRAVTAALPARAAAEALQAVAAVTQTATTIPTPAATSAGVVVVARGAAEGAGPRVVSPAQAACPCALLWTLQLACHCHLACQWLRSCPHGRSRVALTRSGPAAPAFASPSRKPPPWRRSWPRRS